MRLLFIDLETTGLPKTINFSDYYSYELLAKYDSSRIVQLAAICYEGQGRQFKEVSRHNFIVKPDNFLIENHHIHGITHDKATTEGISFVDVIAAIRSDLTAADLIVAHNIKFDKNVLLSEMYRYNLKSDIDIVVKTSAFCTSEGCRSITKIKLRNGYKQPKLSELYEFLFQKKPENLHNALVDTQILAECFFGMLTKNMISLV